MSHKSIFWCDEIDRNICSEQNLYWNFRCMYLLNLSMIQNLKIQKWILNYYFIWQITVLKFECIHSLISRFNVTHHHLLQVSLRNDVIISEIRRYIIVLCRKYSYILHRLERMNMCREIYQHWNIKKMWIYSYNKKKMYSRYKKKIHTPLI